jgi:Holliday junction resolvasome RuvABC endonuclease subunit
MILALDTATVTGWALVSTTGATRHGRADFSAHRGNLGALLSAFDMWLSDHITTTRPRFVFLEEPFFRGKGTRTTFALAGLVHLIAHRRELPCLELHNATIKKYARDHGGAATDGGKSATLSACAAWGFHPADDNAADAIVLARWAWDNREHLREAA